MGNSAPTDEKMKNVTLTEEERKKMAKAEKKADKLAKKEQKRSKKKARKKIGCCGCMGIAALVMVLILGAGVGVGWYFADSYLKTNFDLSLSQTIGIIRDLYAADRDAIVTNAPAPEDEQKFYDAVENSLYLKDGTLTPDTFKAITDTLMGSEDSSAARAVRSEAESGDPSGALSQLLDAENIDVARIKGKFVGDYDYNGNYTEDFVATVTDRQLMALVRGLVTDKLGDNEMLASLGFEQLTLYRTDDNKAALSLVVSIDLKSLVSSLMKDTNEQLRDIIAMVVPKELFVTADLVLDENAEADIVINNKRGEAQANMYKLIDGALRLTGNNKTARQFLDETVDAYAQPILDAANDYLDFDGNVVVEEGKGSLKLDIFSALAKTAFGEDKSLTGAELASVYTGVLAADTDRMIEDNKEFEYKGWYDTGEQLVWATAPVEGATEVDYGDKFLSELGDKYLIATEFYRNGSDVYTEPAYLYSRNGEDKVLRLGALNVFASAEGEPDGGEALHDTLYLAAGSFNEDGAVQLDNGKVDAYVADPGEGSVEMTLLQKTELDVNDVAAIMGVGEATENISGVELTQLFDPSRLTKKPGGEPAADKSEYFVNLDSAALRPELTDRMMAALINNQLDTLIGGDSQLMNSLELLFTAFSVGAPEQIGEAEVKRSFVTVGFTVNAGELAGEDASMISGLLGDKLGLTVKFDVSPEIEAENLADPVIRYADFSETRTQNILDVLAKMGVDAFDLQSLKTDFALPIRDLLAQVDETLGTVEVRDGKLVVPDVFSLLAKQMFAGEFTGDEVHDILKNVYDVPNVGAYGDEGHHYLLDDEGTLDVYPSQSGDRMLTNDTAFVDKLNAIIALEGEPIPLPSLPGGLGSGVTITFPSLPPELGRVVGFYEDDSENFAYITYEYDLMSALRKGEQASLLSIDHAYGTFKVDKSQATEESYLTTLIVNKMDDAARGELERMIKYFKPETEHPFAELETLVGQFAFKVLEYKDIINLINIPGM